MRIIIMTIWMFLKVYIWEDCAHRGILILEEVVIACNVPLFIQQHHSSHQPWDQPPTRLYSICIYVGCSSLHSYSVLFWRKFSILPVTMEKWILLVSLSCRFYDVGGGNFIIESRYYDKAVFLFISSEIWFGWDRWWNLGAVTVWFVTHLVLFKFPISCTELLSAYDI